MHIIEELEKLPKSVMTIGCFDGVHLGHQAVLQEVVSRAKEKNLPTCVFTYPNHPSWVLAPDKNIPLIISPAHKLKLLASLNIDYCIFAPFTKALSEKSPEVFCKELMAKTPFSDLILGYDARLGKNRSGDPTVMGALSEKLGFSLAYCPEYRLEDNTPISSRLLRAMIRQGKLEEVKQGLGRSWSILGTVIPGKGRGKTIGFPTANLSVDSLVLPPNGVYKAVVLWQSTPLKAIANLGYAPTFKSRRAPLLEVHIPHFSENLYGQEIEVTLTSFIREERAFPSIEALKAQIQHDCFS